MAGGVGSMLSEHASGLSQAVSSLIDDAVIADNRSKDLAFNRRVKAMNLPPFKFFQRVVFDERQADNTTIKRMIEFSFLIPGVILEDGQALEIQKYKISSTFEAMIKKGSVIQSDTEAKGSVHSGFLGIPKVRFDITQKVSVNQSSDSSQHNTFDIDIEMGQSEASFGYVEVVKALTRAINQILNTALQSGLENPKTVSDEEAKQLEEGAIDGDEGNEEETDGKQDDKQAASE